MTAWTCEDCGGGQAIILSWDLVAGPQCFECTWETLLDTGDRCIDVTQTYPYRRCRAEAVEDHLCLRHGQRREEKRRNRQSERVEAAVRSYVSPPGKPSVVYFIEHHGRIKIGTTTQLEKRLEAISRGSALAPDMVPGPVTLLASVPGDHTLENRYHRQFWKQRLGRTEWFEPSDEIWRTIHQLQGVTPAATV